MSTNSVEKRQSTHSASRVGFVIPYLGKWPIWAKLFFDSCASNDNIRVIVDCEIAPHFNVPPNVHVFITTREALKSRIENATSLKLKSLTGHQLCNFKPFYGLMYAEFLHSHEFWGYCDVDMMLGDLKKFLTDDFLNSTDIFTAHTYQTIGHFTIIRNTATINKLCFEMEDWQAKCQIDFRAQNIDEHEFTKVIEGKNLRVRRPLELDRELNGAFARFGITYNFLGEIAYCRNQVPSLVIWKDGETRLVRKGSKSTEVLYVHFMGTKRWWHWLFATNDLFAGDRHVFSRIGYGGVGSVEQLEKFPWNVFYNLQIILYKTKARSGSLFRSILPRSAFRWLRRTIYGRGRY